jgi:hypothetical protein
MAKYSAKLTNGKTITLEGDEQPTDADFEGAAKGAGVFLVGQDQPQLKGPIHATTIQADPSSMLKRAIDTAMYEAKGVPGIFAGAAKGLVGGANAVLGLVHAPQIPLDTEMSNADQRLGDVLSTSAQIGAPGIFGVTKAVEAAPTVMRGASQFARRATPILGGVAGASEGYRQRGPLGALEGGVIGAAGGGILGRIMRGLPKGALAEGASKANVAEEAAAALREADDMIVPARTQTLVNSTPEGDWYVDRSGSHHLVDTGAPAPLESSFEQLMRGRTGIPPVSESLRSQGESLLSPEAEAHRVATDVHQVPARLPTSARDIMTPQAQEVMNREFAANNPIFKKMQMEGQFGSPESRINRVPVEARLMGSEIPDSSAVDAIRSIMEGNANSGRTTLDINRPRAGGPPAHRLPPPNPNAGGQLTPGSRSPQSALQHMISAGPDEVSLPEQPQPGIGYSPVAKNALIANRPGVPRLEDIMRRREQGAAASRYAPDVQVVEPGVNPNRLGSYLSTGAKVTEGGAQSMLEQMNANLKALPSHGGTPEPVTPAPVKRASTPHSKATTVKSPEDLYKKLSEQRIRTEAEQRQFEFLDQVMRATGASNRGMSYATRGK